jgi:hypothetical protein
MHFRSKAPAAPGRHPSRRRDPADRVPSTAWLAAQEAFSAPRSTPLDQPAVVVVRKPRAPVPPAVPGEAHASTASAVPGPVAVHEKPVRVFRVVTVPVPTPAPAEAAPVAPAAAVAAPVVAAAPRRRRRSVAPDKQPGPVLRIVQPPAPAVPAAPRMSPREELASLRRLMARLDEVLRDIQQARAWRCVD